MDPRGNETISVYVDEHGHQKICVLNNDRSIGSHGIFFGENPLHFVLPVTLLQIILVTLMSQVIYFLLRPIRTPKFISLGMAGIIIGPTFLGKDKAYMDNVYLPRQSDVLAVGALFGAIYSVFIVTLKMDIVLTWRSARRTWKLGVIPYLASFCILFVLLSIYPVPTLETPFERFILSANASFSNFAVICQSMMDLNLLTSELGQIAMSSAFVNDLFHWVFIVLMYVMINRSRPGGQHSSILLMSSFFAFTVTLLVIVRPLLLLVARTTPVGKPVRKTYVILILASVPVTAFIGDVIGISFLYGPLFYGLIVPNGPPLGATILQKSETLVDELFMPLVWAYFGKNIDLFTLRDWGFIMKFSIFILSGYLAKLIGCILISLTYKIRLKHGLVLGLMLNVKGIVEFIIYSRLRQIKMVDNQIYQYLVISTLLTTTILHPIIVKLYKPYTRLDCHNSRHQPRIRLIQHTYRNPEFCIICCIHNEGNARSMISLIEACNPILSSAICAYVVHLIELQGRSTPVLLPVDMQRRTFSSFNYPITNHIMRAFNNYTTNSNGYVTILPYINISPYKNMHEAVCNLAEDKMVSFLIVPFHENDLTRGSQMTTFIRDLNFNFHAYAPCTVGILVDRYSQLTLNSNSNIHAPVSASEPFFHVGVFFVGGPDDREALALASRMSERVNLRMTLFVFVVKEEEEERERENVDEIETVDNINWRHNSDSESDEKNEEEEEEERKLDEEFVDEFKARNGGNRNVVWKEIMVEDGIRVMEAIRGLEANYDLVIVGKRHCMEGLNHREMCTFMENVEMLGIIGDMLASTEFCNGMVPVLVIQCGLRSNYAKLESIAISHKSYS